MCIYVYTHIYASLLFFFSFFGIHPDEATREISIFQRKSKGNEESMSRLVTQIVHFSF